MKFVIITPPNTLTIQSLKSYECAVYCSPD